MPQMIVFVLKKLSRKWYGIESFAAFAGASDVRSLCGRALYCRRGGGPHVADLFWILNVG